MLHQPIQQHVPVIRWPQRLDWHIIWQQSCLQHHKSGPAAHCAREAATKNQWQVIQRCSLLPSVDVFAVNLHHTTNQPAFHSMRSNTNSLTFEVNMTCNDASTIRVLISLRLYTIDSTTTSLANETRLPKLDIPPNATSYHIASRYDLLLPRLVLYIRSPIQFIGINLGLPLPTHSCFVSTIHCSLTNSPASTNQVQFSHHLDPCHRDVQFTQYGSAFDNFDFVNLITNTDMATIHTAYTTKDSHIRQLIRRSFKDKMTPLYKEDFDNLQVDRGWYYHLARATWNSFTYEYGSFSLEASICSQWCECQSFLGNDSAAIPSSGNRIPLALTQSFPSQHLNIRCSMEPISVLLASNLDIVELGHPFSKGADILIWKFAFVNANHPQLGAWSWKKRNIKVIKSIKLMIETLPDGVLNEDSNSYHGI
ncbi:hypothetical protein BC941DRAFT_472909 [Chlamydoabsidia padenii]|nr:hypothetical protein BC941DRAFT_472909 [Chlamydoabsidia padenii]